MNINRSVRQLLNEPDPAPAFESRIPPEAEIESPNWNQQLDPAQASFDVTGHVAARQGQFTCQVYVAPGHYPNNSLSADGGDFERDEVRADGLWGELVCETPLEHHFQFCPKCGRSLGADSERPR